MAKTLTEKNREIKLATAEKLAEHQQVLQSDKESMRLAFELGQVIGVKKAADYMNARSIRMIEQFIEQKQFLGLGFKTAVEFLKSDYVAIGKHQYYDAKKLIGREGEELYELLENAGIPKQDRLLLTPGDVRLEEDAIIIKDQRIPKDNEDRVVSAIKSLAAEVQELSKKSDLQAEKLKQGDKDNKELKKQITELRKNKISITNEQSHPHNRAAMFVVEAFKTLIEEAEAFDDETIAQATLAIINQQVAALEAAYGFEKPKATAAERRVVRDEEIAEAFDDLDDDDDDD